jgi:hypothetical protein
MRYFECNETGRAGSNLEPIADWSTPDVPRGSVARAAGRGTALPACVEGAECRKSPILCDNERRRGPREQPCGVRWQAQRDTALGCAGGARRASSRSGILPLWGAVAKRQDAASTTHVGRDGLPRRSAPSQSGAGAALCRRTPKTAAPTAERARSLQRPLSSADPVALGTAHATTKLRCTVPQPCGYRRPTPISRLIASFFGYQ